MSDRDPQTLDEMLDVARRVRNDLFMAEAVPVAQASSAVVPGKLGGRIVVGPSIQFGAAYVTRMEDNDFVAWVVLDELPVLLNQWDRPLFTFRSALAAAAAHVAMRHVVRSGILHEEGTG